VSYVSIEKVDPFKFVKTTNRLMRGNGLFLVTQGRDRKPNAMTSGFDILANRVARQLRIEHIFANSFDIIDGCVVGLRRPIVTAEAKAVHLATLADRLGVSLDGCVAVGDGANDLPMIHAAGLGIAFNAKPIVRSAADVSVEGDLGLILPHVIKFMRLRAE
jgi:phosphoserine phosphatase